MAGPVGVCVCEVCGFGGCLPLPGDPWPSYLVYSISDQSITSVAINSSGDWVAFGCSGLSRGWVGRCREWGGPSGSVFLDSRWARRCPGAGGREVAGSEQALCPQVWASCWCGSGRASRTCSSSRDTLTAWWPWPIRPTGSTLSRVATMARWALGVVCVRVCGD